MRFLRLHDQSFLSNGLVAFSNFFCEHLPTFRAFWYWFWIYLENLPNNARDVQGVQPRLDWSLYHSFTISFLETHFWASWVNLSISLFFQAAMDISEHVVARIRALGENGSPESIKKLEDQLEKCFEMFPLPQFRQIVLENLRQLPKIPEKYDFSFLYLLYCTKGPTLVSILVFSVPLFFFIVTSSLTQLYFFIIEYSL